MAELSPPVLHEWGLSAALQWLAEDMVKHGLEGRAVPVARPSAVVEFVCPSPSRERIIRRSWCQIPGPVSIWTRSPPDTAINMPAGSLALPE